MTEEEMRNNLPIGRYKHFRGNEYEILDIGLHSESFECLVVYRALYGDHLLWLRPIEMFFDEVEYKGVTSRRFVLIERHQPE